jgi:hypothetical protein
LGVEVMTDIPERVWLNWGRGLAVTQGPLASPPRTEYVRKDVADDALEAERAKARAEGDAMSEALAAIILMADQIGMAPATAERWAERIEEAARALIPQEARAALEAERAKGRAAPKVKPKVKPLNWRKAYGVSRAKTPFGDYIVGVRTLTLPLPMNPQQVHENEDAAKAAAQADYERRILEALE